MELKTSITINSSAGKVWQALTDPQIVKQYFFGTNLKSDWKKGSPIIFEGEWDGKAYTDKGTILEIIPGKLIRYDYLSSFSGMEDLPENYAEITYSLEEHDGKVILTVTQNKIKNQEARDHSEQNWQAVFGKMKELIEG